VARRVPNPARKTQLVRRQGAGPLPAFSPWSATCERSEAVITTQVPSFWPTQMRNHSATMTAGRLPRDRSDDHEVSTDELLWSASWSSVQGGPREASQGSEPFSLPNLG
jgi:hypothetical protein